MHKNRSDTELISVKDGRVEPSLAEESKKRRDAAEEEARAKYTAKDARTITSKINAAKARAARLKRKEEPEEMDDVPAPPSLKRQQTGNGELATKLARLEGLVEGMNLSKPKKLKKSKPIDIPAPAMKPEPKPDSQEKATIKQSILHFF